MANAGELSDQVTEVDCFVFSFFISGNLPLLPLLLLLLEKKKEKKERPHNQQE